MGRSWVGVVALPCQPLLEIVYLRIRNLAVSLGLQVAVVSETIHTANMFLYLSISWCVHPSKG